MEDLVSLLAPLAAFPVAFVAIQQLAEMGSDKMGEAGLLDLEQARPGEEKKEPEPLLSFLPTPQLPKLSKPDNMGKDFFAPMPGEKIEYYPLDE